ncbi:MAG: ATP-binding protein [Kofleriaceae bacterium]
MNDEKTPSLERQTRLLETAISVIQAVHDDMNLERVADGIVKSLVEVAGFGGARLAIDASLDMLSIAQQSHAGTLTEALTRHTPIFIRGTEIGAISVSFGSTDAVEEQTDLLEFVLPTLFLAIDHAVSFAEVLDYRATLEARVIDRTAELAQAREELEHSLDELREAKSARDRLFANINHEIRTPLTMIKLATDALAHQQHQLGSVERQHLDEINAATRRLLHLVDSLLQLSAGDEGKLQIRPSTIDLAATLQHLLASWTTSAARAGIELRYVGPDRCRATVDDAAIDTVIGNFISNAMKFTPRAGRIVLTMSETPEHVMVSVRDTGPGIDPEYIPRLFTRFERSRSAIENGVGGTGIGLSLAKELVDLQGGTIEVTRHDDPPGTSFAVTIPRYQRIVGVAPEVDERPLAIGRYEDSEPVRTPTERPASAPEATILLAEDDEALSHHITQILSKHYRVITAQNGRVALELAAIHVPDLLVTDLEMPEMNGLELTRRFLEQQSTLSPVLIVSAHSRLAERLAGFEAGAVDYVLKPFSADELLARIRSQLALRKLALKLHETQKLAAMGMLSSGLAHELRNPANALVNALEPFYELLPVIQRGENSVGTALYEVMDAAATQIRDLCKNILEFSRSGAVFKRPEEFAALLRRATLVLKDRFVDVELVTTLELAEPVPCAGPLIEQILINLLDNAAFAAGPAGKVFVTARREPTVVAIEVGDTGAGVPLELVERIFDPFFTTKPLGQGTGLGLSVSRRIALNHGGDLRVVRRDAGTVFRLELPV